MKKKMKLELGASTKTFLFFVSLMIIDVGCFIVSIGLFFRCKSKVFSTQFFLFQIH